FNDALTTAWQMGNARIVALLANIPGTTVPHDFLYPIPPSAKEKKKSADEKSRENDLMKTGRQAAWCVLEDRRFPHAIQPFFHETFAAQPGKDHVHRLFTVGRSEFVNCWGTEEHKQHHWYKSGHYWYHREDTYSSCRYVGNLKGFYRKIYR